MLRYFAGRGKKEISYPIHWDQIIHSFHGAIRSLGGPAQRESCCCSWMRMGGHRPILGDKDPARRGLLGSKGRPRGAYPPRDEVAPACGHLVACLCPRPDSAFPAAFFSRVKIERMVMGHSPVACRLCDLFFRQKHGTYDYDYYPHHCLTTFFFEGERGLYRLLTSAIVASINQ
jgi:hypothetical protein